MIIKPHQFAVQYAEPFQDESVVAAYYIESYHARSGFSRERIGEAQAAAFDRAERQILHASYPDSKITLEVVGNVVWGFPGG